ncbi:MAG: RluA family pseudouridine synthase [Brevinema sp.]
MSYLSEFFEKHKEYHQLSFIASEEHVGQRVDHAIALLNPDVSRSALKNAECVVSINGREGKLSHKLKINDTIEAYWKKNIDVSFEPEQINFNIIYRDNDLMVIDKPWGLVVHPAKGHESGTLANGILHFLQEEELDDNFGDENRVGIVHRLDKDTRGLMLIALNEKTHRALSDAFKNREIIKIYKALVKGHPPEHGVIKLNIGRSTYDRKKMSVVKKGGRDARTDFKTLKYFKEHALLACKLFTGRTHQIRVHLLHLGYPIVNDELYSRQRVNLPGMGLIACYLSFKHPTTGEKMEFTLPNPPAFNQLLEELERKTK